MMSKTVVGLFDGADQAQKVVQELKREGLNDARTYGSASGTGTSNISGTLTDAGVPDAEADLYADGVKSGGTLVLVRTDDSKAPRAVEIMERYSTPGASAGQTSSKQRTTGKASPMAGRGAGGQIKEEIVQEEISVGKRKVERPGARISTHISQRPVEENVRLREEEVHVERRSVNRPASEADFRGRDEEIVITETSEEPVVEKKARVVGEVVVSKESTERTAKVRDTVRRKDVHVDKEPGATTGGHTRFESEFREHHRKHDKSGMSYEDASPAYRFGADLSESSRYKGKDWSSVKSNARSSWEQYNPGTWDEAEPAVKFGWENGRGSA
jgi:uncharacterized protein (TIGR02271 family)